MKNEYLLRQTNVRNLIKNLVAFEGKTLTGLKVDINLKYNKTDSMENLAKKMRQKTIKVSELLEIFDVLGYDIVIRKR